MPMIYVHILTSWCLLRGGKGVVCTCMRLDTYYSERKKGIRKANG